MLREAARHLEQCTTWQRLATIVTVLCVSTLPTAAGQAENDVRLVDGLNANEGRVEIFNGGVWLSVCLEYVTNQFGSVACRQLNYSANGAVMYYANSYGAAPGEILRQYINCYGYGATLSHLSQCVFSPSQENCNPVNTLGLSCDTGVSEIQPVRLVNGTSPYEGRVEVFKSGVWGTVTDRDGYSNRPFYNNLAANIVCKALFGQRYDGSVVPKQEATLRYGVAKRRAIVMSNIQCKGNEQFLQNCPYYSASVSDTLEDSLAVICRQAENDVRLVDGPNANEGRVEIFNGGNWSSVCRESVSSDFGTVACRQLNYSGNGAVMYYANSYGAAQGEIFKQYINCYGYGATLSHLSQCVFSSLQRNCNSLNTLGLSCDTGLSVSQPVRLVNGTSPYEGRVEVFKLGVWGTITVTNTNYYPWYNTIAANIACKALFGPSYGGSVVPRQEAALRYGVAQRRAILMRYITCDGNEQFLQDCSFSSVSAYDTLEDSLAVICKQVPEGCNGYTVATNGTLQSPGYPEGAVYSNDTDCLWTILVRAGRIQFYFTDLQVNTTFNPTSNTLQVLDSSLRSTLVFISNGTRPGTLLSSGNALFLWLKAESGTTGIRFQSSWELYTPPEPPEPPPCPERPYGSRGYLYSPRYPGQYQPNLNCTYPITKRRGVWINFVFYDFALGEAKGGVCQDYLQIFDGDSETSPTVGGPLCGTTLPAAIRTNILNSTNVLVGFKTDAVNTSVERAFRVYYSEVEPDPIRPGNYTEDSGSFKSPGYPDVYNGEEDIIWTVTTKPYKIITLSFQDVRIGPCCENKIQVHEKNYWLRVQISSSGSVTPTITLGNFLEIRLFSTLDNGANKVKASWTTECRQEFQSATGTITSPYDADFYNSPAECTYVINAQQPGYYLTIEFSAMSFEKDPKCSNSIQIYDGSSEFSPLLGEKYCGQSLPAALNSSQTQVYIKFSSQIGYNNFSLTYSSHPKVCDKGLMTDNEGSFTSPGFPFGYPSNTYCVWTIVTDDKTAIVELSFDDFSIGYQGTQCQDAFVRVYDGPVVEASTVVTTLCGTTVPPKMRSTGNSMTVVLNVFGPLGNANGFRASYIAIKATGGLLKGFYPYGLAANDGEFGSSLYEELEIPIENGFPYGEDLHSAVNLGANGVLTFDKGRAWPKLDSSRQMVCAYCTYINTQQGVYYHLYQDSTSDHDVLDKATSDVRDFTGSRTFEASVVLAVTWDRVTQYFPSVDFIPTNMGDATFQVALVTDGSESYALVQYRVGHMNWRYPGRWYTIQMGVAKGSQITFTPNVYSGTEIAYEIDNYFGNTGYKGYWVYELGNIPASYRKVCREWHRRNKPLKIERNAGFSALPRCPCSKRGISGGVFNQWRFHRRDEQNHLECYILNVARTRQFQPFGKECCYWTNVRNEDTLDMLVTTPPFAGASLAFNPLVATQEKLYDAEDRTPHVACCEHGTSKQCQSFYNLRPIGKCDPNPAGQWSSLYGDPHITTFDERQYILNGLGEFTLVSLTTANVSFTLQARTERAELRVGVPTNGSVFTAIGVEENGARVFVQVDPNTNTTMVVYAKGIDYTSRFLPEGDNFFVDDENVMLRRYNDSYLVNFPSGISLQLSIRMKALVIGISMPRYFRGLTKGLLGNFNGNQTDDFVLPSGECLNNSLSERQILDLFASKWRVSTNNTVMRYEPRMGPADYNRLDFVPLFLDEVDPSKAKVLCGDTNLPCIYDFLATGDRTFAFQTADLRNLSDILIQQSKNTAPVVDVPEAVYITIGTPVVVTVTGVDPDINDGLTFYLVDNANGALSINPSSGEITITLTSLTPIKIQVFAVDSHDAQSPVESVPIVVCSGCSGHGPCNMSDTRDEMGDYEFQYAVCLCGPAWAGDNCELDKDGCSDNPCHSLQSCTDIPANQQGISDIGYICSACPRGYFMKNGSRDCYDVDECSNRTLQVCDMLCVNTYGSYECSCQDGYRLSTDGHSCDDVNECVEMTDDCQQICNNTAGGFQCQCEAGYGLDNNQKSCALNPDVSEICRNSNCSQGCRVISDSTTNSFPHCFCYQGFDLDARDNRACVDRDECQNKVCDQVCNNMAGGFSCSCYPGYTLNKDQRTCSPCPYLKYGPECRETCTCSGRSAECHPVRGCICQDGWTGNTCAEDVDECAEIPDVCGLNRLCANTKGSYSCICRPGYTLGDSGVCQDIDECTTDFPCKQSEECINIPGTYNCSCKHGYTRIDSNCADINECAINRGDCQQDCVNVPGSFNCECKYGYRLNADRKTCSKVREVCANDTKCTRAHGCTLDDQNRPVCFCQSGYQLDAAQQTCTDIDECKTGVANCSHNCQNKNGSFSCSCPAGMKLDNDGLSCSDCPSGTFGENCLHLCSCGEGAERCDVTSGCKCRQGWTGSKCEEDVDECQTSDGGPVCQGQNEECVNFLGGYKCQCHQGFAADNNSVCQDIDECATSTCDQHCSNTVGSFQCTCDLGFTWNKTSRRCTDIDECSAPDTHNCKQRCDNTAGSYRCSCSVEGYNLNNDGFTCRALTSCQRTDCDTDNGGCASKEDEESCFCNSGYRLLSDGATCARFPGDTTTSLRPQTPVYVRPRGGSTQILMSWKAVSFTAGVVLMLISLT